MSQLDLALAPPLLGRKMPAEPIVRAAEVEYGDGVHHYRWTLTRAWGAGPCILWCGLNPSRADALRDDPTMLREIGFSYRWGFGSLVKVNVHPLVTPRPANLRRWLRLVNKDDDYAPWPVNRSPLAASLENRRRVREQLKASATAVAAWGAGVDGEDIADFLEGAETDVDAGLEIVRATVEWKCLARNDDGSPRHTLARGAWRIPDDAKLQIWRTA